MYTVYSDSICLMDPSKSVLVMDPILELTMNEAGSFSFSIPTSHDAYEQIVQSSRITVFKDEEAIFYGRVRNIETVLLKLKPSKRKENFLILQTLSSGQRSITTSLFKD